MSRSASSLSRTTTAALACFTTAVALSVWTAANVVRQRRKRDRKQIIQPSSDNIQSSSGGAYESLIGNTPMIKLNKLSKRIGRSIYVKMECLNPGGTGKDRAALSMLRTAEAKGQLPPPLHNNSYNNSSNSNKIIIESDDDSDHDNLDASILKTARIASRTGGLVIEGTSGSTGISLAQLCLVRGHACIVVMPDDQALEKQKILKTLGAIVHIVPNAAISNPNHYVNVARRLAQKAQTAGVAAVQSSSSSISPVSSSAGGAVCMDQFENLSNFQIHYTTTGPEIFKQCPNLDAFVMSSGTGGTIAGVSKYLKEQSCSSHDKSIRIVLCDPPGSAMYHQVNHGVAYAPQQRERALKRHRYDTLAEGIGLDRLTNNFKMARIDAAVRVTDQEAVDMAHFLLKTEGLWVGSSSAMNVVAAVRVASDMEKDSTIVTIVCDGGQRHLTRFWNREFIKEWGLEWPGDKLQGWLPECLVSTTAS